MRYGWAAALVCLLLSTGPVSAGAAAQKEKGGDQSAELVFVLPVHGVIDWGLDYSIRRRVKTAQDAGADLIIFEVNSPGGRLDAALEISKFVSSIRHPKTVAYVDGQAASAAALFAVSCREIVMRHDSVMGDCEPIVMSQKGGYETVGEKVQSWLRARFRSLAEKNGYPPLLCEAMVTKELEVVRLTHRDGTHEFVRRDEVESLRKTLGDDIHQEMVVCPAGQLLTMTTREAFEYRFATYRVEDLAEVVRIYGAAGVSPQRVRTTWSEDLVRLLHGMAVTSLLLTVGMLALYFAFKTPGLGAPEAVAAACFAVLFLSRYLVGLASAMDMVVFGAGVVLLAIELFVTPGFGVLGILGIGCIITGLILSLQNFTVPRMPFEYEVLAVNTLSVLGSLVASIILFAVLLRFLPSTPGLHRLVLLTTEAVDGGYTVATDEKRSLAGKEGITLSTLRPAGRADVDGVVVDVVAEGDFVDRGERVRVIEVRGNRVVVRPV